MGVSQLPVICDHIQEKGACHWCVLKLFLTLLWLEETSLLSDTWGHTQGQSTWWAKGSDSWLTFTPQSGAWLLSPTRRAMADLESPPSKAHTYPHC